MTIIVARDYRSGLPVRITVVQGRISGVEQLNSSSDETDELPFAGPGLFDIQVNGYRGLWFGSESLTTDQVVEIVQALADRGIARCFPTIITSSFEAMQHGLRIMRQAARQSEIVQAVVRGFHLEGPYISPVDGPRGAHPLQHVRGADYAEFSCWQQAAEDMVRLVTIAPEVEGAIPFIHRATQSGVVVSIGHTDATAVQITAAVDAGASMSTHLGNGCSSMLHRHSGVLWSQLADDRLTASVIADGWHLPQAVLQSFLRCKQLPRIVLTCDVSGFGGCSPGRYDSGDVQVDVLADGRIVVAGQTQYLAGSGATTGDCVAHLMNACGLNLATVWDLASQQPASIFGEPVCALEVGQEATLTLFQLPESGLPKGHGTATSSAGEEVRFDVRFEPVATFVRGKLVGGTHECG